MDYATKQWAGVVADYYKPRWEVFIRELEITIEENRRFNSTAYQSMVFNAVEKPFTFSTKIYPVVETGESAERITAMNLLSQHFVIHFSANFELKR